MDHVDYSTHLGPEHEALAAKMRAETRSGDGKPEGSREALERCARMLDLYAPECFPANDKGQIHFARAMMESVVDEIDAYLAQLTQKERAIEALVRELAVQLAEHAEYISEDNVHCCDGESGGLWIDGTYDTIQKLACKAETALAKARAAGLLEGK